MNTRSKILVATLGCCLAASAGWILRAADQAGSQAQTAAVPAVSNAPVPIWFHRVARFMNLTDDQRIKLLQLRASTKAQVAAIRADKTLSDDQRRAKVRETVRTALTQAGSLLTPEQHKKLQRIQRRVTLAGLQTLQRQHFQRRGHGPNGRFGGGPGGQMPQHGQWGRQPGPWQGAERGPRPQGQQGGPFPGQGMAMGQRGPGQGPGPFGAGLQNRNLTPEQRQKLAALMKDYREKAREILAPAAQPSPAPAPAAQ